jgi:hypothetical protein
MRMMANQDCQLGQAMQAFESIQHIVRSYSVIEFGRSTTAFGVGSDYASRVSTQTRLNIFATQNVRGAPA